MRKNTIQKAVLLLVIFPVIANATTIKKLELPDVSRAADVIVVGQIVETRTIFENDEPWTIATVHVEKTVKGTARRTIQFKLPGGIYRVGSQSVVTQYEGLPLLTALQRGVFFLEQNPPQYLKIAGWNHGLWMIHNENGREVVQMSGRQEMSETIPLDNFIQHIQRAVKEKRK